MMARAWGWNKRLARGWPPPPRLTPSQWAERYRKLSRMQSAYPGKWRNELAPYLAGFMDLCVRPELDEITFRKAAQVGVSEAVRNVIGYYAHQEPDPLLLVLPDEKKGRKIVRRRILPLFESTPCLKALLTDQARDQQLSEVALANGFLLSLGWSGSPATISSDPQRIVINDEVDKFQPWSGREADPVSLGYGRTQTFAGRRKIINLSTPTTRDDLIMARWEAAPIKLGFYVPCPYCNVRQTLRFDQLRWEKFDVAEPEQQAALVEAKQAAWYECAHCRQRIEDRRRERMSIQGVWAVSAEAAEPGAGPVSAVDWPAGRRVGMHISALDCLWIPLHAVAAQFLRAQGDPARMQDFRNQWLGEVFEQQLVPTQAATFAIKTKGANPVNTVPVWAQRLLATVDVQKDHFYYVVRAWGHGLRSQRVRHGLCQTFAEVTDLCLQTEYPAQDQRRSGFVCDLLGIDSGYRTDEVYRFALEHGPQVKVLKGRDDPQSVPIQLRRVTYTPPDRKRAPYQVWLHLLDSEYFKDLLAGKLTATIPVPQPDGTLQDEPLWALNDQDDPDYARQMASEHKVLLRRGRTRPAERWVKKTSGAANHYWDAEYMQFALAHVARVDLLRPVPRQPEEPPPPPRGITMPDGRPFLITNR